MEIVVVVGLISIMSGILVLSFISAQRDSVLEEAEASVVHAIERARNRSVAGVGESGNGVWIKDSEIRLFTGEEYSGENVERVISLPSSIESNLSSDISLVFERITGNLESDNWGDNNEIEIVLEDKSTGKDVIITVNKSGSIDID